MQADALVPHALPPPPEPPLFDDASADILAGEGLVVVDGWLGEQAALALRAELLALLEAGRFRAARIGAGHRRQRAPEVRRDAICWFDDEAAPEETDGSMGVRPGPRVADLLVRLAALRDQLNRALFLPLRRIECHAAAYEEGAFYRPHLDTLAGDPGRVLTYCYYLNDGWRPEDGGCLRVHGPFARDVEPALDRLVIFKSAEVLHEVLPARARRLSLTGWFSGSPVRLR